MVSEKHSQLDKNINIKCMHESKKFKQYGFTIFAKILLIYDSSYINDYCKFSQFIKISNYLRSYANQLINYYQTVRAI